MSHIDIESRKIGPGQPTFVIAEIGVNHDGSVHRALELVRIASTCGADAVKLQVFRAVNLVHVTSDLAEYQRGRTSASNPVDLLKRYELPSAALRQVAKEIRQLNMIPLVTPFSPADMEVVESMRVPAVKIASPDMVNRPLLQAASQLGKPLLISTGGADMSEVETTVSWLSEWNVQFALMHCISAYPTPASQANLCWIGELARFGVPVGYSDHTTETACGALSVAAGATVIERHLTYDRAAKGPDHAASSDPTQFQRYIRLVREADVLRGAAGKRVLQIEQDVRKVSRQSLVARRALEVGEVLREEDVTVQRPGTGVSAGEITKALGRRIIKPVTAGALMQWDMLDAA
ncbi:MAG TPA: N-acetylneuraminate synthase family protein [Tepidisphaeraceae bacterium]|jgi:sialic acid synthase SpsE|nr:N-acetylneuraminate synthase family protein [Tepidisphaeraceae bacterium]